MFIGPPAKVLAQMGDKLGRQGDRHGLRRAHHPRLHGASAGRRGGCWRRPVSFGFPVILKAAAGGGGRGMRRCDSPEEVRTAFELVQSEAREGLRQRRYFHGEISWWSPSTSRCRSWRDQHGNVVSSGRAGLLPPAALSEGGGVRPGMVRAAGDGARRCARDAVKIAQHGGLCQRRYGGVPGG